MTTIEERAKKLYSLRLGDFEGAREFEHLSLKVYSRWIVIAKFSLIKEIEARLDEISSVPCEFVSLTMTEKYNRIADLTAQKAKLEQ